MEPPDDVQESLLQWEENYKRGLLSFWMMLLLAGREMYAYEMQAAVEALSRGTLSANENSIYRALRRFTEAGLVQSDMQPSDVGPPRRYFSLTPNGQKLLAAFIRRNILVFQSPPVAEAIRGVLESEAQVLSGRTGKDGDQRA